MSALCFFSYKPFEFLTEGIYVRVYEDGMDLLRAAIIGPSGTPPYHDGLFFFDAFFPNTYLDSPPVSIHASRYFK